MVNLAARTFSSEISVFSQKNEEEEEMETRYEMKEEWKTQTELRSTKHQLMMLMRFYAGSQSRHEDSSSSIVGEVECGRDQATGSGARSCSEYCAKIAWWSFALTDAASLAFRIDRYVLQSTERET